MYSNKHNVNILTALLAKYGIHHAVVCPGSRNAPIVHNLHECPSIVCHPVTDERSAAFCALGMIQATDQPVAVCVTSGSALLNVAPAVAEAYYQHLPLVVIAADRPPQWIDQLDGQTLPQPDALGRFVSKAVTLPEIPLPAEQPSYPTDDSPLCCHTVAALNSAASSQEWSHSELLWYCNRLVNEALLCATDDADPRPVLINVPLSEPLFQFTVDALPDERKITRMRPATDYATLPIQLVDGLANARRPMIVVGQTNPNHYDRSGVDFLFSHVIVLHEQLSPFPHISHFDEVLSQPGTDALLPDFIVHVGGTIVSKRLRHFLRRATQAVTWRISPSGQVEDTFMNLHGIVVGDEEFVLQTLNDKLRNNSAQGETAGAAYRRQWLGLLRKASNYAAYYQPPYSQMAAVRELEAQISQLPEKPHIHYANSSAIRLANIYAQHHVWCNRGVNGIEGSLSTAAGFSIAANAKVVCVIGDLSFFYDQNALWNQQLTSHLRILLLNNGCGGIFSQLPGLDESPATTTLIAASHHTTAEGICQQNAIEYSSVHSLEELPQAIHQLLADSPQQISDHPQQSADRPRLLEVFTTANADQRALHDYFH